MSDSRIRDATKRHLIEEVRWLLTVDRMSPPSASLRAALRALRPDLDARRFETLVELEAHLRSWYHGWYQQHATVLYAARTPFQQVVIQRFQYDGFSERALTIDGHGQSTTTDEHIYHELLVHPALLLHPAPRAVFIAGGGELATAREVLRHRSVERVVNAEIDEQLTMACLEHLPSMSAGSFRDERLHMVFDDAYATLRDAARSFDVIIVDVNDPAYNTPTAGDGRTLFSREFLHTAKSKLNAGGVFVTQSCGTSRASFPSVVKTIRSVFAHVYTLVAPVPSYGGAPWSWTIAHDRRPPSPSLSKLAERDVDREIMLRIGRPLRFLDNDRLRESLRHSLHVEQRLTGAAEILRLTGE
ncbi:MAG: fused MFS/spermidine synthase [Nannocystaceae bacterium]